MPAITANTMNQIDERIQDREKLIRLLVSNKFDLNNIELMQELNKYIKHFEFSVHRMYVFQAMSELMNVWGGSWVWAMLLPIPEAAGTLLNGSLYLGVAGMVLKDFNMTDFHQEFRDMQILYNWVMKEGQHHYQNHINNDAKLANPEIQRMISLLAPFSDPDFMRAWDNVTGNDEPDSQPWFPALTSMYKTGASFFSKQTPKEISDAEKILGLQERIEKGEMKVGVIEGLKRAGEYFTTSPDFKKMATTEVMNLCQKPIQMLKDATPSILHAAQKVAEHQHPHQP